MVTNFDGTRDETGHSFTVTDQADDYTLDSDTDQAAMGDVLGTLIKELIQKGVIKGSVTPR
jgi:hypothetical protein